MIATGPAIPRALGESDKASNATKLMNIPNQSTAKKYVYTRSHVGSWIRISLTPAG